MCPCEHHLPRHDDPWCSESRRAHLTPTTFHSTTYIIGKGPLTNASLAKWIYSGLAFVRGYEMPTLGVVGEQTKSAEQGGQQSRGGLLGGPDAGVRTDLEGG